MKCDLDACDQSFWVILSGKIVRARKCFMCLESKGKKGKVSQSSFPVTETLSLKNFIPPLMKVLWATKYMIYLCTLERDWRKML